MQRYATSSSVCIECPKNAVTEGSNSTRKGHCQCAPFYYAHTDTQHPDVWDCRSCFTGINCNTGGSALRTLSLMPGFFRTSENSTDVRRCADSRAGCDQNGHSGECKTSTSGCIGGSSPADLCRPGLTGVFCQLCTAWTDHNVSSAVHYVRATDQEPAHCAPCSAGNFLALASLLGVCLLLVLAAWAAQESIHSLCSPRFIKVISLVKKYYHQYTVPVKLKTLIVTSMGLGQID